MSEHFLRLAVSAASQSKPVQTEAALVPAGVNREASRNVSLYITADDVALIGEVQHDSVISTVLRDLR